MPFQSANESITIWFARLSYPHLWEPTRVKIQGVPTGDPRYSTQIVLDPKDERNADSIKSLLAIEAKLIAQSWPGKTVADLPPNFRRLISKGSEEDPHVAGKAVISANSKADNPPSIVVRDAQGKMVPTTKRDLIFPGCEAHVNIGIFTYMKSAVSLGVAAGLNLVWPSGKDVERFDKRVTATQAFGDAPDDVQTVTVDPFAGDPETSTQTPGNEWDLNTAEDKSDPTAGLW